jgi:hypothetical protein
MTSKAGKVGVMKLSDISDATSNVDTTTAAYSWNTGINAGFFGP